LKPLFNIHHIINNYNFPTDTYKLLFILLMDSTANPSIDYYSLPNGQLSKVIHTFDS